MESVESNEGGETLALGGAKCFHFSPFSIYFSQWMAATYRTNLHGRKTCSIYVVDEQRQINRYRYRYIYLWYLKIQFKQTPPDIERRTPGGILSVSSINFGQFCNILAINKNYWKMVSLLGSKFIPSVSSIVIKESHCADNKSISVGLTLEREAISGNKNAMPKRWWWYHMCGRCVVSDLQLANLDVLHSLGSQAAYYIEHRFPIANAMTWGPPTGSCRCYIINWVVTNG